MKKIQNLSKKCFSKRNIINHFTDEEQKYLIPKGSVSILIFTVQSLRIFLFKKRFVLKGENHNGGRRKGGQLHERYPAVLSISDLLAHHIPTK